MTDLSTGEYGDREGKPSLLGALVITALLLKGCGDPISAQADRDQRQADINSAIAGSCGPGETFYPGAGSAWYIEPTPGACVKD